MLLASLEYTKQDAAEKFPKDIAAMEQSLKRLEEQEQTPAQGFDPVQLYEARQDICPDKEQEAEDREQKGYGEKYSPLLMFDSKKTFPYAG